MDFYLFLLLLIFAVKSQYDWSPVKDMVNRFYNNGTYPGAVLRIANSTHNLFTYQIGYLTKFSHILFTQQTIFDIASLTKVTATLSSIMRLYEQGKIKLQDPVIKYIPQYNNKNKQTTIIQNLLLHNAGLQQDTPNPDFQTKQQILNWIFNCELSHPIGTKYLYSDLGFILLGLIVQRITHSHLNLYAQQFFQNIHMHNTTFLPSSRLIFNIAPTQYSQARKRIVRGEVHDPSAHSFGGVAGDAGVFSIASDLQKYMQFHLSKGKSYDGRKIFKQQTVGKFYTRVDNLPYANRRALGWDTVPIQQYPPCGHLFSQNSFGHTGYTGTMMWADREKNLIVVLLTNRVNPTSQNKQILKARTASFNYDYGP